MRPWLSPGDAVAAARRLPLAGDCVVFLGPAGGLVVHRLIMRAGGWCLTKGDFQLLPARPRALSAVTGVVVAARRAGRGIDLDHGTARASGLALAAWAWPCVAAYRVLQLACWLGRAALDAARLPSPRALAALETAPYAFARLALSAPADRLAARLPETPPPSAEGPRPAGGPLDGDQTWTGEVRLVGDVVVPRGATLTLAAGCRVLGAADKRVHHGARRRVGDAPRDADPRRPRFAVYGRLVAAGATGRPVLVEGLAEIALYGGALEASVMRVTGAARGVSALDGADARLRGCVFEACGVAVESTGGSKVFAEGLRAARADVALLAREGGRLDASGVALADCAAGARAADGGRVRLEDVELTDCGAGLESDGARSRLDARGLRARRVTLALRAASGARLDAADAVLADCAEGARSETGGRLSARGLDAALSGDAALRAEDGSVLRVSGARLRGSREALVAAGGRLTARALTAAGTQVGAAARAGGRLLLSRARLTGGSLGVEVRAGSARATGLVARGRLFGASVSAGTMRARRALFRGGEAGVLAADGAAVAARAARLRGSHGLLAKGDASVELAACRFAASEGHGVWLQDTARARLTDASVRRAALAAALVSGSAQLDADGLKVRGAGLVVEGGAARVARLEARAASAAVSALGGTVRVSGWSACGGARGATACGDAVLELSDGLCADLDGWALSLAGRARAIVTRARFVACGGGADVAERAVLEGDGLAVDSPRGSGLRLRGDAVASLRASSISGAGEAGALLEERARLELDDVLLDGCGLAATGGAALLRRVEILDAPGAAVDLSGGAHALEECSIDGKAAALRAAAGAAATAADCAFTGCAGAAVLLAGDASVRLSRVRVERCGAGADADERARLSGEDLAVLGPGGHGLRLRGASAAALAGLVVSGAGEAAVLLEDDARLELAGGKLESCGSGVSAAGGTSVLRGVRLAGHRGAGADLGAGEHALESCVLEGSARGVSARGVARVRAEACRFDGHGESDASAWGGASLSLERCRLRGGRSGLRAHDASTVAAGRCLFDGHSEPAVRLGQSARAILTRCLFRREWMAALAEDRAALEAARCRARGGPTGFKLDGDSRALLEDCGFVDHALDGLWVGERAAAVARRCAFIRCRVAVQRHARAAPSLESCAYAGDGAPERVFS